MLTLDESHWFEGRAVAWGMLGSGPPLVMIHGTPFSSQVWRRIAPWLAARRTVYVFDLLGYGRSDMTPDRDVSLGVQNRLLADLFRAWELEAPEVVAHDFGGATALRAHYLDGLRYSRLTLIDPVALAPWGSPFVSHVRSHETAFAGLPHDAHESLLRSYVQGAAARPLGEEVLHVLLAPWRGDPGQGAFYRQIAQMDQSFTDSVEGRYGPMPWPVQILWGERDAWVPLEQGRHLAQRLEAPLTVVPGAGHLVQEDAPEAVVAALLRPSS